MTRYKIRPRLQTLSQFHSNNLPPHLGVEVVVNTLLSNITSMLLLLLLCMSNNNHILNSRYISKVSLFRLRNKHSMDNLRRIRSRVDISMDKNITHPVQMLIPKGTHRDIRRDRPMYLL